MSQHWQYQLRVNLAGEQADVARRDPGDPAIRALSEVLERHGATLICQYQAFADYVAEAEAQGTGNYPLYAWTKATIENPAKKLKYLKSFTLYVDGQEVYAKDKADALEKDLQPLVGGPLVTDLSRHDTNPANNPQLPKRYRQ